jgi:hypothetical protein
METDVLKLPAVVKRTALRHHHLSHAVTATYVVRGH